ncbi:MAG: RDD family protein [Chitinophagaceae bacterium]|nr:RDD family protein [Chitinophagaceae bacterium]
MQEHYPELKERLQSTFIDTVFILMLMFFTASLLDSFKDVPDWVRFVLFIGLLFAYEPICMVFGCTVGNYFKKIRVRKYADSSRKLNILQAAVRYPVKVMLGWVSFVTIHSNAQRRAIHDMAAGSVMIKL